MRIMDTHGTARRPSRQIIHLHTCLPENLRNREDLEAAIRAAAENHFGIVSVRPWPLDEDMQDPEGQALLRFLVETCHRHGVQCVMKFEPDMWARPYLMRNPEMATWLLVPGESVCDGGVFDFAIPYEGVGHSPTFRALAELPAVYGFDAAGQPRRLEPGEYQVTQETFRAPWGHPSLVEAEGYEPHKAPKGRTMLRLSGRVNDSSIQRLCIYVAFESYELPDQTHPEFLKRQLALLESFRDLPLDGFAWDEPANGSSMTGYKAGRGFLEFFQKRYGYDLRTRLLELDRGTSAVALQTRRDYYEALNEGFYLSQKAFNDRARELFGSDIFLGWHQTWSGLAVDLGAGCTDYFRQGEPLSAAFTDTGWDLTPYAETIYNYVLAESLRKELGKPLAYCMDWSKKPVTRWYDYYTRLKMLYGIEWILIAMGRGAWEGFPNLPWDRHWPVNSRNAAQLEAFADFTGRTVDGESEMAVWHGWQGVAGLESAHYGYLRLWMTCHHNLAQHALEAGRFFDYASTQALAKATVREGRIHLPGGAYRRLSLACAVTYPNAVWAKVRECVAGGVEVVFVGPPPRWLIDDGSDLTEAFAQMCGCEPVSFERYHSWAAARKPLPRFDDWEPVQVDFAYPVKPLAEAIALTDADGETVGVRNPQTGVTWFSSLDPRELFFQQLPPLTPGLEHFGPAYCRLLQDRREPARRFLVCAAPLNGLLHDTITVDGRRIVLEGGTWAVLHLDDGRVVDRLLSTETEVALS